MITDNTYIKNIKDELMNNKFGITDEVIINNYINGFDDKDSLDKIKKEFNDTFTSICSGSEERKQKILEALKNTDSIFDYSIVEFAIDNFPGYMKEKYMHGKTLYMFGLIDSVEDLYYIGFDQDYNIHFVTACAILEADKKNSFPINKKEIPNIKKDFEGKLIESDRIIYMII